jgi:protein-tyrosine phosphatase
VTPALDPPLRVDWIDPADLRDDGPGRLGLTFLPGKRGASMRYPGRIYRREVGADLDTLRELGVRRLVLLIEDAELERWGDPSLPRHAERRGLTVDRFPLRDGTAPASVEDMDRILERIAAGRGEGDVAVACMGGVGRTGTVAACALVAAGWTSRDAIGMVRRVRHPTAVETDEQVRFVDRYERHVAERGERSDIVSP